MDETSELVGWLKTFGLIVLGWGIKHTWDMMRLLTISKKLLVMHEKPDDYGFGTGETNKTLADSHRELTTCINGNTAVVKELIHYMKWSHKDRTGKELPPPMANEVS